MALNKKFMEGQTNPVTLVEEDVDTFQHFVHWLYSGTFDRDETWDFDQKIRLWIFGDCRQIPLLQNAVLNEMRNEVVEMSTVPNTRQVDLIYAHTASKSALRRFIIDVVYRTMSPKTALNPATESHWTKEALWDILRKVWDELEQRTSVSRTDIKNWELCTYHIHEDGVSCPRR